MFWIRHPGRALDAYVDEELSRVGARRVRVHLGGCPECRRRAVLTEHIRASLRTVCGSVRRID